MSIYIDTTPIEQLLQSPKCADLSDEIENMILNSFYDIDDLIYYVESVWLRREYVNYIYALLNNNEILNIDKPKYTIHWANKLIMDWTNETIMIKQTSYTDSIIPPFTQDLMIIISLLQKY